VAIWWCTTLGVGVSWAAKSREPSPDSSSVPPGVASLLLGGPGPELVLGCTACCFLPLVSILRWLALLPVLDTLSVSDTSTSDLKWPVNETLSSRNKRNIDRKHREHHRIHCWQKAIWPLDGATATTKKIGEKCNVNKHSRSTNHLIFF
jgi:hypothetical protein